MFRLSLCWVSRYCLIISVPMNIISNFYWSPLTFQAFARHRLFLILNVTWQDRFYYPFFIAEEDKMQRALFWSCWRSHRKLVQICNLKLVLSLKLNFVYVCVLSIPIWRVREKRERGEEGRGRGKREGTEGIWRMCVVLGKRKGQRDRDRECSSQSLSRGRRQKTALGIFVLFSFATVLNLKFKTGQGTCADLFLFCNMLLPYIT